MDETDLNIEEAIVNIVAAVTKLDDYIKQENDEGLVNALKAKRELLMQVLRELDRQ